MAPMPEIDLEPPKFGRDDKDHLFEQADAPTKALLNATFNTDRVLQELRFIRWVLIAIAGILCAAFAPWWPN